MLSSLLFSRFAVLSRELFQKGFQVENEMRALREVTRRLWH